MKAEVKSIFANLNWQKLPDLSTWVIEETLRIQRIPAPTFHEAQRAKYLAERFSEFDLEEIEIDHVHNVFGRLAGNRRGNSLMVMAHTDTVFPMDTDLSIKRGADLIYGPGIGDNSLGVAALLGLMKAIREFPCRPDCDIWFVADSCEEGLGDLRGAKAAFAKLQSGLDAVINIEGLALGFVYNAGIAVHRLRILASAEGGHSWLHYGRPSAIHGLMELGNKIAKLAVPKSPRTTINIGMIDGGHAINAIATNASLWLDLRSTDTATLIDLRRQVAAVVESQQNDDICYKVETVGKRPAGSIANDHVLVQGALAALGEIGFTGLLETGSTDGNVPLANGYPAVTIGITRGGNAHRLDEYIKVNTVRLGLQQLIGLVLAASRHYARSASAANR